MYRMLGDVFDRVEYGRWSRIENTAITMTMAVIVIRALNKLRHNKLLRHEHASLINVKVNNSLARMQPSEAVHQG